MIQGGAVAHQKIMPFTFGEEVKKASLLLYDTEKDLPINVRMVIEAFSNCGVGFLLSRNNRVYSCRDARSQRYRLGHIGIPLFDELKSVIFKGISLRGEEIIFAAHCRAHVKFNLGDLEKHLCLVEPPVLLPEDEMFALYGMVFGTVNPALIELSSNGSILNVLDTSLFVDVSKNPGTIMTNAGEHTWGIEFDPKQLINLFCNYVVLKCTSIDVEIKPYETPKSTNPRSIGIITGNGPDSGMALWRNINQYISEYLGDHFLGDISFPSVHVISVPALGLSMELDKRDDSTWIAIKDAILKLKELDIELLALACNTTHYYSDKIRTLFEDENKKFISMADETLRYIQHYGIEDVAILGIPLVANLKEFSAYSYLQKLSVEKIPDDVMDKFFELGYEVKKMKNPHAITSKFLRLLKSDIKSKNVILALTELSLIYEGLKKRKSSELVIIDTLSIYAQSIACKSLGISTEWGI